MIDELKITILNRVINELFQEVDNLIKEGVKLTQKNKKIVTVGLSLSVIGVTHAFISPASAIVLDFFNLFVASTIFAQNNVEKFKQEAEKVKDFFQHFNVDNEDIVQKIKIEFMSDLRVGTYLPRDIIDQVISKGVLNLQKEEIESFSKIHFNDNQENHLKQLIAKNEKINVINFLDLTLLDSSSSNKKFVNLGGKNKTLKDIMEPPKKYQMKK